MVCLRKKKGRPFCLDPSRESGLLFRLDPSLLVSEHGLDLVTLVELNVCLGMTVVGVACLRLVQMRLVRMR